MQAYPPKPLQYMGGKDWLLPMVLPMLRHTPASVYVEPFLGSASVFLRKEPHAVEVVNDYDKLIYTIYKYIQDKDVFQKAMRLLYLTPMHREFFQEHIDILLAFRRGEEVPAERLVVAAMLYLEFSVMKSLAREVLTKRGRLFGRKKSKHTRSVRARLRALEYAHLRFQNAIIECRDAFEIIQEYDSEETVFYLDPPYHDDTLSQSKEPYGNGNINHEQLVDVLLQLKGRAILSCYDHAVYHPLSKARWQRIDIRRPFSQNCRLKITYRTETLYLSPGIAGYQSKLF